MHERNRAGHLSKPYQEQVTGAHLTSLLCLHPSQGSPHMILDAPGDDPAWKQDDFKRRHISGLLFLEPVRKDKAWTPEKQCSTNPSGIQPLRKLDILQVALVHTKNGTVTPSRLWHLSSKDTLLNLDQIVGLCRSNYFKNFDPCKTLMTYEEEAD